MPQLSLRNARCRRHDPRWVWPSLAQPEGLGGSLGKQRASDSSAAEQAWPLAQSSSLSALLFGKPGFLPFGPAQEELCV